MDSLGNKIQTVSCWNGHYEDLVIEDLELSREKKVFSQVLPFISFYKTGPA